MIIRDQDNEQRLLHKYNNIMFIDDEGNQHYIIAPENLEIKGPARRNKNYCVVCKPLNWRDGDNVDLLISIEINDDFMVLIRVFEQDPDLGVKIVHTSIYYASEDKDSYKD